MFLMKNAEKIRKLSITIEDFVNNNYQQRNIVSENKYSEKLYVVNYYKSALWINAIA